jgi:outer membrane autotransporter protein
MGSILGAAPMENIQRLAAPLTYLISGPLGSVLSKATAASARMGRISLRQIGLPHRQRRGDLDRRARQLVRILRTSGGAVRWSSFTLGPILLIAAFTVAIAGVSDAQTIIGPGTINSTQVVSGGTANVVGNTTINVPGGDGIDAPGYNSPGPTLNINTELSLSATPIGPGPISITTGGTGVASIFPSSPATININSGPHGNVDIVGGGAAIGVSGDVSLTASNAKGGSLTFESTGNYGVVAQFGANVNITGATIISSGFAGVLIGGDLTDMGAVGTLTNVNIQATNAYGLVATRKSTMATMSGGSIMVTGTGLAGLYSDTNGITSTNKVTISTTGANTYGAFAEATIPATDLISPGGGTINITGGSITTGGMGAFGVFAQGEPQESAPSSITLNNSMITTGNATSTSAIAGAGAAAYRADDGTISATNTTAQTFGQAAPGGMLSNGGILTINGGSVKASGAGSFGFLVEPFDPSAQSAAQLAAEPGVTTAALTAEPTLPNVVTIENGATVNSAADAFHVDGAIANIAVTGSSVTSNNGVLLNTVSSGTTMLTANSAQLTGTITTDATSTANVTLQNNTTWTMTGNSNLSNLVNDPSTIVFTPPSGDPTQLASYKTLTVNNYTGMGGRIVLNTFLGTDGSPSDRLIINGGTATGTTGLLIHNTGGPGAQTFANGISVVEAINGGTTAAGAFGLAIPVIAGSSEYMLFRGGLNPGSDPQNWFLRDDFVAPPPTEGKPEPEPEPPQVFPPFPPDPPPQPLPPNVYPIIGPRFAAYGVVQPIARELGMTMLGTLHERIGDTMSFENAGMGPVGPVQSAWGRFFGEQIDNSYQAFAAPNANGHIFGFQAGLDLWRGSFIPEQRDAAGLYFAYGNANVDVNGLVTNAAATAYVRSAVGTLGLNGYSVGGYWTHYGPGNWYLDAVVQGTFYGGSADAQFGEGGFTTKLPTDGSGVITSLEAGYPVAIPALGPRFVLEPQGQILWQHVDFNQAFDGLQTVGLRTTSGVTGRLGLRGQWSIASVNDQVWQPYGRINFWRAWGGNAATNFGNSGVLVPLIEQATWGEVAAGVTFKYTQQLSYYAQFGYQFAITSNTGISGFIGDIGLRYTW